MSTTAPSGSRCAGVAGGLTRSGGPDVALILHDGPDDAAAAVFTTNRFPAAPVLWSRQVISGGRVEAVVLNSGRAKPCTGREGFGDTHATAERVAAELGVGTIYVAAASTRLISVRPMDDLTAGVTAAVEALPTDGDLGATRAVMTTDSVPKTAVQQRNGWTVGGMAKGAGMLAPSMAVLTADAVVPADVLQPALEQATSVGLERVDPLGCLSTNDTTTGMASGVSVVTPDVEKVSEALTAACTDLAVRCWRTRRGDPEDPDHRPQRRQRRGRAGGRRACAPSSVLETAPFGNDANWVRARRERRRLHLPSSPTRST